MYFNQDRENTSIDAEFQDNNNKKGFDLGRFKLPLIIIIVLIILILIIVFIVNITKRNKVSYFLTLNDLNELTVYQGSDYDDPGYRGFDSKKNDLTSLVVVDGKVDINTIGTYTITYSLKNVSKTRIVNVVKQPDTSAYIHLTGDTTVKVNVGKRYREQGYSAVDIIDGDVTKKVTVTNNVDTSKKGTYYITYSVVGSNGKTVTETRTVIVE